VLALTGLVIMATRGRSFAAIWDIGAAVLAVLAGVALIAAPWALRFWSDLRHEQAELARATERADIAAHLHDSVLQTLALIQKSSHDPATVARLARAQERDLRSWLYAGESTDERTVASALRGVAARVEDEYAVSVDVVSVGDCDLDEHLRPLVKATGEAVTNAAKHAGTGRVDVYAEVTPAAVDVFVRDRGRGFDPATVPADRYGVRNSIVDRMRRHGGAAEIRSTPGEGTEVRLHLARLQETRAQEDSHE
jgi:signal transduction histidine kinase